MAHSICSRRTRSTADEHTNREGGFGPVLGNECRCGGLSIRSQTSGSGGCDLRDQNGAAQETEARSLGMYTPSVSGLLHNKCVRREEKTTELAWESKPRQRGIWDSTAPNIILEWRSTSPEHRPHFLLPRLVSC